MALFYFKGGFMAQYDGSIRIGTGIDTDGFDEDGKKLESKAKNLAKNISDSSDVELNIDTSAAEKKVENFFGEEEKRIEELAKKAVESAKVSQTASAPDEPRYGKPLTDSGYNKDALKFIDEHSNSLEKTDENLNLLRIDVEEYAKSLKELQSQGKFFGDEEYDKIYITWKNATDAVKAYRAELNKQTESGQAKLAEQEAKATEKREAAQRRAEEQAERALQRENERIQKQAENEAKLAAKEAERQAKIQAEVAEEQRLADIKANATISDQQIIELLERRKQLIAEIKDMESAGVGLGYKEFEDANRELEEINGKIKDYRKSIGNVPEKFEKMRKSANKAFTAVASGTKKSSGLLSTFSSRLKGIALSLLIFNWISKGFNAMISGMKKGFENLMGYSDSYAQSVQSMKNAMSTLGNQFAAAFAPIVQMVIPWINSLINVLTTAMTHMSQFIAILAGKSTFTHAVQIQDKYNKSLGGTAAAAKKAFGALAKFDDLDVLQKQDDAGGGAGVAETLPKDMFEEVPVDKKALSWLDSIIKRAKELKDIFAQGFWDGLGDWGYSWESIKENLQTIKNVILGIITDAEVLKSVGEAIESVVKMIGTVIGSISSIILTIIDAVTGGIAKFLEQNEERIKEFITSISNIVTAISDLVSKAAIAIAYVFEAFSSEQGQQLIANILGIISAVTGVVEIVFKIFRDLLNIVILPFIENADKLKTALEGLLGFLSNMLGTIKQGLYDTFAKLNEIYDAHFKPFFDSVAQGISDLTAEFMEFWNTNVQPILDEFAEKFDTLWKEHIQPMFDKFAEVIGKVGDMLKALWENILKPIISWAIKNVLPVILPILEGIGDAFLTVKETIADVISDILDAVGGIIDFLTGVFEGDWEKAWNGIVDTFKGIFNIIPDVIEGIINKAIDIINGIIGGINAVATKIPMVPEIPEIEKVSIPRLATGAVLRGGNPFMAILNDQPAGKTNIEAPLATIEQAVENVMSRNGYRNERVPVNINLNYDGETFARLSISDILSELGREGYNVDVLGVT